MSLKAANFGLTVFGLVLLVGIAYLLSAAPRMDILLITGGGLLFVVCLFNMEIGIYVIIVSMLLSPEIAIGQAGSGETMESSRSIIVRVEDITLVIVSMGWFARTAVYKELGLLEKSPMNLPVFAYLLTSLVSTLYGAMNGNLNLVTGLFYTLKYMEYALIYFMVVNYIKEEAQVHRVFFVAVVTCVLVSLYGIFQIPMGERVTAPFEGTTGEPNTLGGYLVFMLAFTLTFTLHKKRIPRKVAWACVSALLAVPLLFTLSRASWLGAVPMVAITVALAPRRSVVIMVLLVALVISPFLLPKEVKDRFAYTFEDRSEQGQVQMGDMAFDTSTSARLNSWLEGIRDWQEHVLLGFGITGYGFMDAQYVRVLVETGILGLAAFFWMIVAAFRVAVRVMRQAVDRFTRCLAIGYIAGTAGLLTHALGANTFILVRIMEPFWLMTALVVVCDQLNAVSGAGAEQTPRLPARGLT